MMFQRNLLPSLTLKMKAVHSFQRWESITVLLGITIPAMFFETLRLLLSDLPVMQSHGV